MNPALSLNSKFLFVAIDRGPYLTLQSIEEVIGADYIQYLAEGVCKQERIELGLPYLDLRQIIHVWGSLENYLRRSDFRAIIRSTSEDVIGLNIEDEVSAVAKTVGIPLFVVEDFPGNYWPQPGHALSGLFTETEPQAGVYRPRGVPSDLIHNVNNPRRCLPQYQQTSSPKGNAEGIGSKEWNSDPLGWPTRWR